MGKLSNLAAMYRPKNLMDMVGQEHIVTVLKNAINKGSLHPAYLFVGQFGSGKTSAARIIAAMENCLVSPGLNPCGKCRLCKSVFDGDHNDVVEIDAASAAGKVDQIRQLKTEAMYNPIDGAKTKYFIIDECHRASSEAIDALLKLVEDPPAHCRFIFCTTDIQKVKPTLVSRCQRHDVRKIYWSKIGERLTTIAQKEKIDIDVSAINLCAKMAFGSMRAGLQNLEKLISFVSDEKITIEHAQQMFGSADPMLYFDLIDQIIGSPKSVDLTKGFRIINSILSIGADFTHIYSELVDHLRNILVCMTASKPLEFVYLTEDGKRRLKEQIKIINEHNSLESVLAIISKLNDARLSVDRNIPPEAAFQLWLAESIFIMYKNKPTSPA